MKVSFHTTTFQTDALKYEVCNFELASQEMYKVNRTINQIWY